MTGCDTIREDLVAYLDGELNGEARARVQTHLDGCASCREEAEFFRSTWAALGAYPELEASPDFLLRLADRLSAVPPEEIEAAPSWVHIWLPRIASAAAILAVLWFGRLAYERLTAPPDTPTVVALTADERAMITDLQVLGDAHYDLVRDLDLVEHYPVLDQLNESDYDEM